MPFSVLMMILSSAGQAIAEDNKKRHERQTSIPANPIYLLVMIPPFPEGSGSSAPFSQDNTAESPVPFHLLYNRGMRIFRMKTTSSRPPPTRGGGYLGRPPVSFL